MLKNFIKNLKNYVNYLMSVNFKDLFINTVIILCIVVLSGVIYVPVWIVEDLIRSLILAFGGFSGSLATIYNWIFDLISAICFVLTFIFLFNKRFEDIEKLKDQMSGKDERPKKKDEKDGKKSNGKEPDFDLPKTKES